MSDLEAWKRAALLKDRTRRAIRDRVRAGEQARSIAKDYDVPVTFVQHMKNWQLFEEDSTYPLPKKRSR